MLTRFNQLKTSHTLYFVVLTFLTFKKHNSPFNLYPFKTLLLSFYHTIK